MCIPQIVELNNGPLHWHLIAKCHACTQSYQLQLHLLVPTVEYLSFAV